jgi:hypothetical protein
MSELNAYKELPPSFEEWAKKEKSIYRNKDGEIEVLRLCNNQNIEMLLDQSDYIKALRKQIKEMISDVTVNCNIAENYSPTVIQGKLQAMLNEWKEKYKYDYQCCQVLDMMEERGLLKNV